MEQNANGREIPLESGASLYVSAAPWRELKALHDAFCKALVGGGISREEIAAIFQAVDFKTMAPAKEREDGKPLEAARKLDAVAALTRKALELASNGDLEKALFACAEKAIYRADGRPETSAQFKLNAPGYGVFDNPVTRDKAREDYYAICETLLTEYLRPFGKALFSMFMAHVAKSAGTPESTTASPTPKS